MTSIVQNGEHCVRAVMAYTCQETTKRVTTVGYQTARFWMLKRYF